MARAEKGKVKNVIKVARQYEEYLLRPEVLGYRDVADHFGVTKPTVSYYRALLNRLPDDFVSWLESCDDPQVLAFFSQKRLRPITRIDQTMQRAALLTEAERLAADLDGESDVVSELRRLLDDETLPTPKPREFRAIQVD